MLYKSVSKWAPHFRCACLAWYSVDGHRALLTGAEEGVAAAGALLPACALNGGS